MYRSYVVWSQKTDRRRGDAAYFQQMGVMSYDDWRVTYYNPASMGTSHENLGYYTVGQGIYDRGDGIGVTSDGYIAVAMPEDQTFRLLYFTELYKYELSKKDEKVLEGVTRGR